MNPHTSNPLMFILEADPDRYIKTPAAAILAVLKAAEGVVAFMWCFRMLDCLRRIIAERLSMAPVEVLGSLLPGELTRLVLPTGAPLAGTVGMLLGAVAAACMLLELASLAAEAVAAVLLRFADRGAKLFKTTRKLILGASFVLTVCVVVSCVWMAMDAFSGSFRLDASLHPLIVSLLAVLLLILYVAYNRSAAIVMEAVEYEIRLGFKETGMKSVRLGWYAFLFGVLFLAAAAAVFVFAHLKLSYAAAFVFLAVKFFAVWQSWRAFKRRHR